MSYIPPLTYRLHINGALPAQRPALAGLMAVSPRPHHLSIEAQGEHVVPYAPAGGDDAVAGRLWVEEGGVGPADTEVRRPLGLGGELDNLHLKVPAVVHGAALTYANIDVRVEAGGGGGGFTEAARANTNVSEILYKSHSSRGGLGMRPPPPKDGLGMRPPPKDGLGMRPPPPKEGLGMRPPPKDGLGMRPPPKEGLGMRPPPPKEGLGMRLPPKDGLGMRPPPKKGLGMRPPPPKEGLGMRPPPKDGLGMRPPPKKGLGMRPPPPKEGLGMRPPPKDGLGMRPPPKDGLGMRLSHQRTQSCSEVCSRRSLQVSRWW